MSRGRWRKAYRSRKSGSSAQVSPQAPSAYLGFSSYQLDSVAWAAAVEKFYQNLPPEVQRLRRDLSAECVRLEAVYADKSILLEVRDQAHNPLELHHVLVSPLADVSIRCTCSPNKNNSDCVHGVDALLAVQQQLLTPYSTLARRINQGAFCADEADLSVFQMSPAERVRSLLDRIPIQAEDDAIATDLPAREHQPAARILWNFYWQAGSLQMQPLLQEQKKRGQGWKKGRRISVESLFARTNLSETDTRLRALYRFETTYATSHWKIDPVEALKLLVDAKNVAFQQSLIRVQSVDAAMEVVVDHDKCWLQLHLLSDQPTCFVHKRTVIAYDLDKGILMFCELTPRQAECLASIFQLPAMPVEMVADLISKSEEIGRIMPVHIPAQFESAIKHDEARPVILLRSETDGSLDYGLRVRDCYGHLRVPGKGNVCQELQHADRTTLLQRSFANEKAVVERLAESLQLPTRALHGTIDDFLQAIELIERLQAAGEDEVEVLWDKSSEKPIRILGSVTNENVRVGISRKRDWFQLEGDCQLGNDSVSLKELLEAISGNGQNLPGDYVRLGNKGWARIGARLRRQLQAVRDAATKDRNQLKLDASSAPAIRELIEQDVAVQGTRDWNKCLERLHRAEMLEPRLPPGLQAELREYQLDGYKWLRRLAEWGVGGILADDMGLGKTLQTLAVILDRAELGPTLVIAPSSVGFNWVRECQRFTPQIETFLYRESDREELLKAVGPQQLVVCSYGLALRDAKLLAQVNWNCLVLDEAQAIKNSRSKTSMAVKAIPADWKLALTGTPVENHLGELWSLFHVVAPGVLGGWEQFRTRFAAPIEKDQNEQRQLALRERLKPFILRRTKAEVLNDLPARTETNVQVALTDAERRVYDASRLSILQQMERIEQSGDARDQRFQILALLTRMRQLACSPRLVDSAWKERSSKLEQLCETLHELREEGHRVLVFSQFVKYLALIREMLDEEQITYEYLDGSTPAAERGACVDRFQNGEATAFLISLKAGGTGLNLTAADYVIHMDPWWNPAVEDQATDRAHRIGQVRPVMVYRFVAENTIEAEILNMHETKRDLVQGILQGSQAAAKLSTQDLINLVKSGSRS